MYLDKNKISENKLIYGGLSILFSIGMLGCAAFIVYTIVSGGGIGIIISFLFIIAVLLMFLATFVTEIELFGFLNRLQSILTTDSDGFISVESASKSLGMTASYCTKKFNYSVKQGYLINCSLGKRGGEDVITLVNDSVDATEKFEVVKCKNCGAFSEIKLGFVQACPYCGGPLLNPNRNFDIFLKDAGREKILTTKVLVDASGLRLKHAFDLVLAAPTVVMRNVPYEKAIELEKLFREAGATVELQDV